MKSIDGTPIVITSATLARNVNRLGVRSELPGEEKRLATLALKEQLDHPAFGLKAAELPGSNFRIKLWREH